MNLAKLAFVGLLLVAPSLSFAGDADGLHGSHLVADRMQVEFLPLNSENCEIGLVVSAKNVRVGFLSFYAEGQTVPFVRYPIQVRTYSFGLSLQSSVETRRKLTLSDFNGKKVVGLTGKFWGWKGGLGVIGGASSAGYKNAQRVHLVDTAWKTKAVAFDVSRSYVHIDALTTEELKGVYERHNWVLPGNLALPEDWNKQVFVSDK